MPTTWCRGELIHAVGQMPGTEKGRGWGRGPNVDHLVQAESQKSTREKGKGPNVGTT